MFSGTLYDIHLKVPDGSASLVLNLKVLLLLSSLIQVMDLTEIVEIMLGALLV